MVLIHLVDRWRLCRPGVTYHDPLGLLVKVLNFDINATVPLIYTIFSAIYYSVFNVQTSLHMKSGHSIKCRSDRRRIL